MNILNKFTIQNLKLNKKRTIVTIIGIMLSTALICGVVGLVSSFQKSFVNMIKDSVGNYHTRFYDVPKEEIQYIQDNINVKSSFLTNDLGYAYLEGSKNEYKPYVTVLEYDDNAFNNNGIKLIEGRFPQNSNELLISEHIKTNARVIYNIGDKVKLNVGKRVLDDGTVLNYREPYYTKEEIKNGESIIDTVEKEYTIVGIMERPDYTIENFSAPGYTVITHIEDIADKASISVVYKNSKNYKEYNKEILKITNEDDEGIYEIYVNSELLRFEGVVSNNAMKVLLGIASVVMVIIVTSSIFVIRNSFSISVSEKNRQYGMLSSIGATKKQIKQNVIYEGFIIGLIAIPLGILSGVIGISILLKVVNYLLKDALNGMKFVYSLPLIPVLISVVISFLTIYLSCLLPARRASKISPIEAIRGNNDIKIKSKKIKTPKYINKLFGIGGVIASKNLKRCRRKYTTTVISIVISIVIFISLSSFIHYGNIVSNVYYTEIGFNIMVEDSNDNVNLYKKISKLDNVENYAYYFESSSDINEKYCSNFGKEMFKTMETKPQISVMVYSNEYFKQYIKNLGVNEKDYALGAILVDDVIEVTTDKKKVIQHIYDIKSGDTIDINLKDRKSNDLKILAKTDKKPMGLESIYVDRGMIVISEDCLDKIGKEYYLNCLFIKSDNATELENTINDYAKTDTDYSNIQITNYDKLVEMQNRMVLVISIFLYGFISVITLIGVTNIFNTITTNMILRSKEFAMLKSIGMTIKEFNKMIRLESILYGLKALLIGIPIGIVGSYLMYMSYAESIDAGYSLPIKAIVISIVFVFIIVGSTMKYSLNKINKQNIIDTIRNDNI